MITPENRITLELLLLAAMFLIALRVAHPAARTIEAPRQARRVA